MKLQFGQSARRLSTLAAVTAGMVLVVSNPASAAYNDGFAASTTNSCGSAIFVDYGEGASGGGNNDDYVLIRDNCSDSHGVRAWAWVTEHTSAGDLTYPLGSKYNGNGVAGADVVWDPFLDGNVRAGDTVKLKICLVDGSGDTTGSYCGSATHTSVDG
ncbi:MAG: hypothetical protein HOV77_02295 [Hamadaea sp.]|uniref:hypothetical protein n=1 Tax=Hamadaea sp. TaxID=2024425 RepID=UPI0017B16582|nr:hypothetical protein [Hamadaea sp.]NUT17990.1 hypothetical protein [Hamadaea sp.]